MATQTELPITDARQFLNSVKAAAVSQRNTFLFCLLFVLVALLVLCSLALFVFAIAVHPFRGDNRSCGQCGSCRGVEYIVLAVFRIPELSLLVISICSAPPLVFSLWLMTTPDDRQLLLHPHKFRVGARSSIEDEGKAAKLRTEAFRMGINLR